VLPAPVFGAAGSGERHGWIALSRRQAGAWISNFDGYAISETSLLPLGTVLIAQRQLPVWAEPQLAGSNDPSKLQNMLPARACVRVLATRPGIGLVGASGAGLVQRLGCAGSAGSGRLGRQFPRLCNLRNVVAASRHRIDRAAATAGMVGTATCELE
jgi:hypothetical protein